VDVGEIIVWIVWAGAAASFVLSAVGVISFTNPFYSALMLIGNLAALAVMYLLLSAEFLAAAQVLVYAGAVMVMFLFVIAYLGGRADAPWRGPNWQVIAAITAGTLVLVEIFLAIGLSASDRLANEARVLEGFGSPGQIGEVFLVDHLLAFEITSIVLLVAAVGGVILGSHSKERGANLQ
jgi:NADH-quinone oxidoreductase subunit J